VIAMTFEDTLRDQLRRDAGAVPLPAREPERAVARARTRRRRRTVAAGVAATAALVAALAPLVGDGGGRDRVDMPYANTLPRTGPLDFDWSRAEGGLGYMNSSFQADDGTVYALSTAPGVRWEDHPAADLPMALYALADDGTWQPAALDGDRPDAMGMSTAGGLLYAVSTGTAANGDGRVSRLSSSTDGGDTWTTEDVPAPPPPTDAAPLSLSASLSIESVGSTTVAVINTSYYLDYAELFPQLDTDGGVGLTIEERAEGPTLVRLPEGTLPDGEIARAEAETTEAEAALTWTSSDPTTTVPPEPGAPMPASPTETPEPPTSLPPGEVVQTIPWSDLGLEGPGDLGPQHQVLRWEDGAWVPLEGDPFDGLQSVLLVESGDRFVATAFGPTAGESVLTSDDGLAWSPVTPPGGGEVVGIGGALVSVDYEGAIARVSTDAGASWSDVDLTTAGVAPGSYLLEASSGPLGLALVFGAQDQAPQLVVTGDLVDWTVVPVADVVGTDQIATARVIVGADRLVVTATQPADVGQIPASLTAVGTPVRDG
jgi:hypothetical protein